MSNQSPRILITGASGNLGRLVISKLLETIPVSHVAAIVRSREAATELTALGIAVHIADYAEPQTLEKAFAGIDRLLLVSSSEVGGRVRQHRNVIEAAKRVGVKLLIYTSILHADSSPLLLAQEHRETEALLAESGLPFVLLRNGWYTENEMTAVPAALAHGALFGSSGEGKIAWAARADYAAAAAAVLLADDDQSGRIYELAGDDAYTRVELAAEISRQSDTLVTYKNLPQAEPHLST